MMTARTGSIGRGALWTLLAFASLSSAASLGAEPARTELFILGTLYSRHDTVAAYDLPALRRIILAIAPDVLVIDCTPTEVRERKVHASKIEYPKIVFPLMQEQRYAAVYAAEPDEPLFTQIVKPLSQMRSDHARAHPDSAKVMDELETATYAALRLHWQSPASVHDALTARVLDARKQLDERIYGPVQIDADERWNDHWAAKIREAAAAHPGKRILALAGLDNRWEIERRLRDEPGLRIVDVAEWLATLDRVESD